MKSAYVNYLAILILILLMGIGALNLFLFLRPEQQQPVLKFNDVRGMAVEHEGLLYTLNFDQQNGVVKALNAPQESKAPLPVSFTRLVIYRFGHADKIYTAEELSRNVPLINILSNSYDINAKTPSYSEHHSH